MRNISKLLAAICLLCSRHAFAELVTVLPGSDESTISDADTGSSTETAATTTISNEVEPTSTQVTERRVDELAEILKENIYQIRQKYKKIDVVFLLDASSSVGKNNFLSELKFVTKFLSDFNVSFNYTRVALVTFSSQGKIVSIDASYWAI